MKVEIQKAKQIGQRLALKSGAAGLLIAYIIFSSLLINWDSGILKAIIWITDVEFGYHLIIGAIGLLVMAYLFGQRAGIEILIKGKNELWVGVKYGFVTLITGTLIASSVGFIEEGIDNIGGFSNPFYDYYFKPMYWILMFGFIPTILIGLWFGVTIKKNGRKNQSHKN